MRESGRHIGCSRRAGKRRSSGQITTIGSRKPNTTAERTPSPGALPGSGPAFDALPRILEPPALFLRRLRLGLDQAQDAGLLLVVVLVLALGPGQHRLRQHQAAAQRAGEAGVVAVDVVRVR